MTTITLKGEPIQTAGNLPQIGTKAPNFSLTKTDLTDVTLESFSPKRLLLNIFPSLDTAVCAQSVRTFNLKASGVADLTILCISQDLPFAHKRFCDTENIRNVMTLSCFRNPKFGQDYGVTITSGPLRGLLSRAIVLIDTNGKVLYTQQVPEITQEPDYRSVLSQLEG